MKHVSSSTFAFSLALALSVAAAPASAEIVSKVQASPIPNFDWTASYSQKKTRDDQGEARREMKAGNQLSLREIEKRVLPKMRGAEYLGPTYDAASHAYRLKFIKDGRVMYVDVDARSGKIVNRSR
ncbi:MAG: PepSY domain-containing protein [Pseudomonadota bacterium]